MRMFKWDTREILNKIMGMLFFFLGGILVFLSFYLPQSVLRTTELRFVIPVILAIISIILVIQGYLKLTENDEEFTW